MSGRISSAPVFLQVIGLVLAGVVAAQLVNLAVVVFSPDPAPAGFSVTEAARALKGERVRLRGGGELRARRIAGPPAFRASLHAPMERVIGEALSDLLERPAAAVKIDIRPPEGLGFKHKVTVHAAHVGVRPAGEERGDKVTMHIMRRAHDRMIREHSPGLAADSLMFPPFAAAVRQPDGGWLLVEPPRRLLSAWQHRMMLSFALAALLLAPLAYAFARGMTKPIRTFAAAAERLGADPAAPPLKAEGPREVRTAITAFNDMQEKLRGYIEGRTVMLAAIAHDLRTPLTRLRFHAEASPAPLRQKMTADIAEMDAMIGSVLAFVRTGRGRQDWGLVDLSSLAAAAAEDFAELGGAVSGEIADGLRVQGDALALKRLIANLVDNALKFTGAAEIGLRAEDGEVLLSVSDRGPGLPADQLERAFEPFHRLEPSRSRDTGGVGLGLATARAIAREHGGEVTLANRDGGGLAATVRLPLSVA